MNNGSNIPTHTRQSSFRFPSGYDPVKGLQNLRGTRKTTGIPTTNQGDNTMLQSKKRKGSAIAATTAAVGTTAAVTTASAGTLPTDLASTQTTPSSSPVNYDRVERNLSDFFDLSACSSEGVAHNVSPADQLGSEPSWLGTGGASSSSSSSSAAEAEKVFAAPAPALASDNSNSNTPNRASTCYSFLMQLLASPVTKKVGAVLFLGAVGAYGLGLLAVEMAMTTALVGFGLFAASRYAQRGSFVDERDAFHETVAACKQ